MKSYVAGSICYKTYYVEDFGILSRFRENDVAFVAYL